MYVFWVLMILLVNNLVAPTVDGSRFTTAYRSSAYTVTAKTVVLEKAVKWNVIISPTLPVNHKGINYYWYGKYTHQADHPQKCEYVIDKSDKEFQNVTFKDGSRPESIQFGCLTYQDCCGLECCGDNRNTTVVICITFLIFLGIYAVYRNLSKGRQRRPSPSVTQICPGGPDIAEETV